MGLLPLVQVPTCSAALKENRLFRTPDLPAGNKFGTQNRARQPVFWGCFARTNKHLPLVTFEDAVNYSREVF